jgi:transmembrane sensor
MQIVESIKDRAARWAVRAVAGPLSPDEQNELDAWLNADARHRGAYVLARAQWVDLDRLAALHGPANSAAIEFPEPSGISRRHLLAASVAAITVVGGGGLSWLLPVLVAAWRRREALFERNW